MDIEEIEDLSLKFTNQQTIASVSKEDPTLLEAQSPADTLGISERMECGSEGPLRSALLQRRHKSMHRASLGGTPGLAVQFAEETSTPTANVVAVPRPPNRNGRARQAAQRQQIEPATGRQTMPGNRQLRNIQGAAGSKRKLRMSPFSPGGSMEQHEQERCPPSGTPSQRAFTRRRRVSSLSQLGIASPNI